MNPLNFIERLFNTRALERELSIEKAKVADLEFKVNSLSSNNEQLREKVQILEEIHNNPLKFDEPTGTWVNELSALRYCAKCKAQNIISPLKNSEHGWSCPVCNSGFKDPSRPYKTIRSENPDWRL